MRCEDAQLHLLDPTHPEAPELAAHLRSCPECRELGDLWMGLDHLPAPLPDPGMADRFERRLRRQLRAHRPSRHPLSGWGLPLAAAMLLAVGGAFQVGYRLRPDTQSSESPVVARLRQGSASERLQTLALVSAPQGSEPQLMDALLERVMQDPAPEVRLAAVEALYLFGGDPSLGLKVADALPHQELPRVQLALVDLLVALRERRAAEALRQLLREDRLGPEARLRAKVRLAEQRL